ncbi:MAG: hypothetical protein A2X54_05060 [Nitrospirae bacterium GWF2_44_13]|nr:MAG: hypothetical protein A2X54_05060 [Nitrospirae bacterium GWF2_44_13]OGW65387.1 MAG: hypothetical protein A2222_00985 [Nitrospirae bacterium RIFOXYA2_FULL_44_9]OGW73658.1 MAG: hypothetical protein A2484_05375 [Nitrospirae bacterium RIFOXYC2_FULL_44_7]HBG93578.1 hypothetical protein [Nitrospiraceae bacterium]
MAKKWQHFIEEGYLLVDVFIQALALGAVIILIPLPALLKVKLKVNFPPYFALLGIGFIFIEISLIHSVILMIMLALETEFTAALLTVGLTYTIALCYLKRIFF